MRSKPYREGVGALIWASTTARPDIADTVRSVARYCEAPGRAHWKAVMNILAYLGRTMLEGITYGEDENDNETLAYADTDYATDVNGRLSVSLYAITLGRGAISCFSRMQRVTGIAYNGGQVRCTGGGGERDIVSATTSTVHGTEYGRIFGFWCWKTTKGLTKLANNFISSYRTKRMAVK